MSLEDRRQCIALVDEAEKGGAGRLASCRLLGQVLSFITEPGPIRDILKSLGMATAPPEMARKYPKIHARLGRKSEPEAALG